MVFQHGFILRIEERQHAGAVQAGNGEPEVEVLVVDPLAVDAVEIGGVLGVGIRFGIEVFDGQFPVGKRGVFLEKIVHAAHVELDLLRHVVRVARGVIADHHAGIEFLEERAGAGGERVVLVLGEIVAAVAHRGQGDQPVGQHDDGDQGGNAECRAEDGIGWFVCHGRIKCVRVGGLKGLGTFGGKDGAGAQQGNDDDRPEPHQILEAEQPAGEGAEMVPDENGCHGIRPR